MVYQEDNLALEAAKYLIQLYMSTKYCCNRQKLQKLILFSQFACLIDGKDGFLGDESITASNIGLGIESVSMAFSTLEFNGIDAEEEIGSVNKRNNEDFSFDYRYNENKLGEKVFVLKEMFKKFGAYSGQMLSAVTRELEVYPSDVNFMQVYNYTVTLSNENVMEYIYQLKEKYKGKEIEGIQTVQEEIKEKLSIVKAKIMGKQGLCLK